MTSVFNVNSIGAAAATCTLKQQRTGTVNTIMHKQLTRLVEKYFSI